MSAAGSRVVVLASGGLDSCVTVALAAREHELALLHASYGQRTEAREREAFRAVADHYEVPAELRLEVEMPQLAAVGGSSLTDDRRSVVEPLPEDGIPGTYVPFRNAHLLAAGVSWAEVLGAEAVHLGAVEEDSSGYPDCRESFLRAFERAVREGTRPGTRLAIVTPLLHLSKGEIVRRGLALGAPLDRTWSCYQGESLACGRCESCRLRLAGFREAGTVDPLSYAPGGAERR